MGGNTLVGGKKNYRVFDWNFAGGQHARPDPCARSQSAQAGVGIDTEEGPAADALEQRDQQKDLQSGRRVDRGRLHALVRCGAHRAGPVAALNLAKRGQGAPGELAAGDDTLFPWSVLEGLASRV